MRFSAHRPELDSLLDRDAVCRRLGCSKSTIERYERRGWLKAIRIGPRLVRYRLEDLREFESRGEGC